MPKECTYDKTQNILACSTGAAYYYKSFQDFITEPQIFGRRLVSAISAGGGYSTRFSYDSATGRLLTQSFEHNWTTGPPWHNALYNLDRADTFTQWDSLNRPIASSAGAIVYNEKMNTVTWPAAPYGRSSVSKYTSWGFELSGPYYSQEQSISGESTTVRLNGLIEVSQNGVPFYGNRGGWSFGRSTNTPKMFTVTNKGLGNLVIKDISISGKNASDFTITSADENRTILAGGAWNFTVAFTPTSTPGFRNAVDATLSLATDDSQGNSPFMISLAGSVPVPPGITSLASGEFHACVVTGGNVVCWGKI